LQKKELGTDKNLFTFAKYFTAEINKLDRRITKTNEYKRKEKHDEQEIVFIYACRNAAFHLLRKDVQIFKTPKRPETH
jgi:hypothetical protein